MNIKLKNFKKKYPTIVLCEKKLVDIRTIIKNEDSERMKSPNPQKIYSRQYLEITAVILAYSIVETTAKEIIYDFLRYKKTSESVVNFVKKKIRSTNINVENLYSIIDDFDKNYTQTLKDDWNDLPSFAQYKTQINTLKDWRNGLSHQGQTTSYTTANIITYFDSSILLLHCMYNSLHKN